MRAVAARRAGTQPQSVGTAGRSEHRRCIASGAGVRVEAHGGSPPAPANGTGSGMKFPAGGDDHPRRDQLEESDVRTQ